MEMLSATFEIFVLSVTVAIFGGTALLVALESKMPRPASVNRKVGITPVDDTLHQINCETPEPANAVTAGDISKAA